jgi:hypothetical protein
VNSNPDEIYRQKAMLEPLAPTTLWLYPELKLITGAMQRSALADVGRSARRYWLSYVFRFSVLALGLLGIWVIQADRADLRRALTFALPLILLAWFFLDYRRTRVELRTALDRATGGQTPNTSLERTREG